MTNRKSFDNTRAWLAEINEYAHRDVIIMLLGIHNICSCVFIIRAINTQRDERLFFFFEGNKCDSEDRVVGRDDGERLAREYRVNFMETSAKTGLNVEPAFIEVAR